MSDSTNDQTFIGSPDVAAFVRKNADFYVPRWADAVGKAGSIDAVTGREWYPTPLKRSGWNWGALVLPTVWLAYRKMWGLALTSTAVVLALLAWEEYSGKPMASAIGALAIGFAFWGNSYYLRHVRKKVTEIQRITPDADTRRLMLTGAGGTSPIGAICMLLVLLIGSTAITLRDDLRAALNDAPALAKTPLTAPEAKLQTASAARTPSDIPGWKPWLSEMSGMWSDGQTQTRIYLSPRGIYIEEVVDPNANLRLDPMRPTIKGTDDENDIVVLSANVGLGGSLGAAAVEVAKASGKTVPTTTEIVLRRMWNDAHSQFQLQWTGEGGAPLRLGFVRRFLPDEDKQLAALVSAPAVQRTRIAAAEQTATPRSIATTPAGSDWKDAVGELTGVWVASGGVVRIYFTPERLTLQLEDSAVEPQIVAVDPASKSVSFTVKGEPQAGTSQFVRIPSTGNAKGFDLIVKTGDGSELALQYARALTQAETAALSKGEAFAMPQPPQRE